MSLAPPEAFRAAYDAEAFRRAAHATVDQLADYLGAATAPIEARGAEPAGMARLPVLPWKPPDEAAAEWADFLSGPNEGLAPLIERVLAGATHLHRPRYMGHQVPPVLPAAAVADLAASILNNSMTVYEMGGPGAVMERAAVGWMARILGLGGRADGVLTSGGSIGNLTALLRAPGPSRLRRLVSGPRGRASARRPGFVGGPLLHRALAPGDGPG